MATTNKKKEEGWSLLSRPTIKVGRLVKPRVVLRIIQPPARPGPE
jgi:hypothetical protein